MKIKGNTNRIQLVNCDIDLLYAILKGDDYLAEFLGVSIANNWSEFGTQIFRYSLDRVECNPQDVLWWTYLVLHHDNNQLIGTCGYKGPPDENGMVEIGYEISEENRNQGFATELVQILAKQAFTVQDVQRIWAETKAEENASVSVLRKNNFVKLLEFTNEDGWKIWRWEKLRD